MVVNNRPLPLRVSRCLSLTSHITGFLRRHEHTHTHTHRRNPSAVWGFAPIGVWHLIREKLEGPVLRETAICRNCSHGRGEMHQQSRSASRQRVVTESRESDDDDGQLSKRSSFESSHSRMMRLSCLQQHRHSPYHSPKPFENGRVQVLYDRGVIRRTGGFHLTGVAPYCGILVLFHRQGLRPPWQRSIESNVSSLGMDTLESRA